MSKSGTISWDCDGVLANFTRAFTRTGHMLFGTPVSDNQAQKSWMFEDFPELNLTKVMCEEIWSLIKTNPFFWSQLDPLNPSLMREINKISNRIFITNRPGLDTQLQTKIFLSHWGIENPEVIVAEKKAPVAQHMKVMAHIDDYIVNCREIKDAIPHAYVALLSMPYNMEFQAEWLASGGEIVLSADHFMNECIKRDLIEWR